MFIGGADKVAMQFLADDVSEELQATGAPEDVLAPFNKFRNDLQSYTIYTWASAYKSVVGQHPCRLAYKLWVETCAAYPEVSESDVGARFDVSKVSEAFGVLDWKVGEAAEVFIATEASRVFGRDHAISVEPSSLEGEIVKIPIADALYMPALASAISSVVAWQSMVTPWRQTVTL